MATSYVFENTEVVLTGRRAEREIPNKRTRAGQGGSHKPRTDELVEITPEDKEDGSWKKFVRMTDLYKITE